MVLEMLIPKLSAVQMLIHKALLLTMPVSMSVIPPDSKKLISIQASVEHSNGTGQY
jgi:hypothetical protein